MATAQRIAQPLDIRINQWFKENRRTAIAIAVGAVLAAGGTLFWKTARDRREDFAERAFTGARASAEAGNLPLAASDLARVVSTFDGTRAGQEATLLLAQVRLLQGQPALAVGDLRKFVGSGPRVEFRGPGSALLGGALEEAGQPGEAAKAYEAAANATEYKGIKAQYLMDAARTFATAGNVDQAIRIYERVVNEFKTQSSSVEAQVRLTELRKNALSKQ